MHIHSLLALTLAVTTSALPSLPGCLVTDENHSRACHEVGPVQSKLEIVDGQKQQNRGGLQGQIEYVDQQIGKEIECPGCGKNIVGDLVQSRSIGHNNMVTGQGEQQLDMINGKTHEEWVGVGQQQQQDSMPHGQKSNFKTGQNQKRNHLGQHFDDQSSTHGPVMYTGKTQQDELLTKGQGKTQELYNTMGQTNGRIQERDITHNWANQLNQGQNQEQQEQFNKGAQQIEGLYTTGNTHGIIQDFNKGGQNQQLYNGQQIGTTNQLYKTGQNGILLTTNPNHQQEQFNKGQGQGQQLYNGQQTHQQQQQWNNGGGPNDILMTTTHQFYQGQPINTQQLNNKGQGIQQLHNGQQTQQLNKIGGEQTQQLNNGNWNHQTTQELFKTTTNGIIQARHETAGEHFDGHQEEQQLAAGNSQSKQQQEEIEIGGGQHKNQQEAVVLSPQQMMDFVAAQSKQQQQQQQWVREQVVTVDGKQQEVWTCV
ncbi:hypothetical protein NEUTE1DRAFT_54132 [Neurospora tetrasperma FGSC 2508]|uniref:Uncharacterized protein n=1 Tax=Neurospora tetrasperma (strain FGSC 2508 / ATCC MYA-4615 / P0657) TaxID=510951 RepID=F8N2U3_NEUT8|nr:uncharacterized protein NEUTE1DRAFT_54132 [Neurospora tetrasperma FGSC 2508]EGO53357.1 hypothetical protein NEUTE1DRAFT_54132 [Neurospora tetrasperma FGSC 2508]